MTEQSSRTSVRIERFCASHFNVTNWETLKRIEGYARKCLTGRKDWDEPHTELVVFYTLYLSAAVKLDLLVMAGAAWMHDTGYEGLFDDNSSISWENVKNRKEQHMIQGARKTQQFLQTTAMRGRLFQVQAERMAHLVAVHDNIEQLKDLDEVVLMEADTLGAIDVAKITPTFCKQDLLTHVTSVETRRAPKFVTALGIQFLNELLPKYREYASNQ